jgi:hypothetical protein
MSLPCSAILICDVCIFQPLGLDNVVHAITGQQNKIWFVVTQIACIIRVLDCKSELFRQLGKALYIRRLLEELRELPFELVMARNEVEDAFVCREWRVRSFSRRRRGRTSYSSMTISQRDLEPLATASTWQISDRPSARKET